MEHLPKNKVRIISELILGIFCLVCGSAIYLLFRSKTLNIYQWCVAIGLSSYIDSFREQVTSWNISDCVKYSLPDGLYCAAYLLMMDAIWYREQSVVKYIIMSIIPIVTIGSEIFQYWGFVKGTFDIYDLLCYVCPTMMYLFCAFNSSINN